MNPTEKLFTDTLLKDLQKLIHSTRQSVAITVNSAMTLLYWQIGKRILEEILQDSRAEYGQQITIGLAKQLTLEFGKSFSTANLRRMIQFAEFYQDEKIVVTLSRQLTWSHMVTLITVNNPLKREFYVELCKLENWSVRQLRERINSMLFERTAISKKPDEVIKNDLEMLRKEEKLSQELVFKDQYFLDFLGLTEIYSEKDLESAILIELQKFIIELGQDFAFIARQKRITIDNRDYYIDLLFYHRRLKSLIVIDLKIGEFEAGYKGQLELYLRYLEKYQCFEGENLPIGLILCTGTDRHEEHIELLQLSKSNIRIAEYLTELPSKELLQVKLHQSIEIAKNKLLNTDK